MALVDRGRGWLLHSDDVGEKCFLEVIGIVTFSGAGEGGCVLCFGFGQRGGIVREAAGVVELAAAELHEKHTWLFRVDVLWLWDWGGAG